MRVTVWLLASVALLLPATTVVKACVSSRGYDVPTAVRYYRADAVFLARLSDEPSLSKKNGYSLLKLEILENFKGDRIESRQILNQSEAFTSCDVLLKIKKGQTWVIFAELVNGDWFVKEASFMDDSATFDADISLLRKIARDGLPTTIYGQVVTTCIGIHKFNFEHLPVVLNGNGITLKAKTDKGGSFNFSDIPAGEYNISIVFPFPVTIATMDDTAHFTFTRLKKARGKFPYTYSMSIRQNEAAIKGPVIRGCG